MPALIIGLCIWLAGATVTAAPALPPPGMSGVGPGLYRPQFPASPSEAVVNVPRFFLDRTPVTNADYLGFVRAQPKWRRSRVKRIFADGGYLESWRGDLDLGSAHADAPVTGVSWFAAKAYCAWRGRRLPTEREWELAAAASATSADGMSDASFRVEVLGWYQERGRAAPGPVGRGTPNYWGVFDLHTLVWEWVGDFSASLVALDARERDDGDKSRFCGAGAALAADTTEYAAFMRIAYRSSLEASYTTRLLGFRCAKDAPQGKEARP